MRSRATTTPSGSPRKSSGASRARPLSLPPRSTPVNRPSSPCSEASRAGMRCSETFGSRPSATAAVAATTRSSPSRSRMIRALAPTSARPRWTIASSTRSRSVSPPTAIATSVAACSRRTARRSSSRSRLRSVMSRIAARAIIPWSVATVESEISHGNSRHRPDGRRDRGRRPSAGAWSVEVVVAMGDVTSADALRHQHLDPLADQLVARVAEHGLGSRIDELDLPGLIDADDGIGCELKEFPLERLAGWVATARA